MLCINVFVTHRGIDLSRDNISLHDLWKMVIISFHTDTKMWRRLAIRAWFYAPEDLSGLTLSRQYVNYFILLLISSVLFYDPEIVNLFPSLGIQN